MATSAALINGARLQGSGLEMIADKHRFSCSPLSCSCICVYESVAKFSSGVGDCLKKNVTVAQAHTHAAVMLRKK